MKKTGSYKKIVFSALAICMGYVIIIFLGNCNMQKDSIVSDSEILKYQDSIKAIFLREFQASDNFKNLEKTVGIKIDSILVIPRNISSKTRVVILYTTNTNEAGAMTIGNGNFEIYEVVNGLINRVFSKQYYNISEYSVALVATNKFNYLLTKVGYSGGALGDQDFEVNIYDVSSPSTIKKLKQLNYGYGDLFVMDSLPVVLHNENGFFKILRENDSVFLQTFEIISNPKDLPDSTALLLIEPANRDNEFGYLKARLINKNGIFESAVYSVYDDSVKYSYTELQVGTKLLIELRDRRSWNSDCDIRSWDFDKKKYFSMMPYISSYVLSNCTIKISNDFIIPIRFRN